MAFQVRTKVTGVTGALAALASLSSSVREQVIAPALDDAAELIATEARQRCPVKTGALRRSIRPVKAVAKGSATVTAAVEATEDYAEPVEKGHQTKSGSFVRPRPFLGPAAAAVSPNRVNALVRARLAAFVRGLGKG